MQLRSGREGPAREQVAGCEPAPAHALHPLRAQPQPCSPHVQRAPRSLGTRLRPHASPWRCQRAPAALPLPGAAPSGSGGGGESSREGDESASEIASPRVTLAPGPPASASLPQPARRAWPPARPRPRGPRLSQRPRGLPDATACWGAAAGTSKAHPGRPLELSQGLGRAGGRAGAALWSRQPANALTAIEGFAPGRQRNQGVVSRRKAAVWSTPPKRSVPVGFVACVASVVALEVVLPSWRSGVEVEAALGKGVKKRARRLPSLVRKSAEAPLGAWEAHTLAAGAGVCADVLGARCRSLPL